MSLLGDLDEEVHVQQLEPPLKTVSWRPDTTMGEVSSPGLREEAVTHKHAWAFPMDVGPYLFDKYWTRRCVFLIQPFFLLTVWSDLA